MEQNKDKQKALELSLAGIEKQYGKGAVMKMGEKGSMVIGTVPTGALALDLALGIGGLPRGRVVEIYGPESSGKTTIALHAVAEAQRLGGIAAFIDAEHALDPIYAKKLGERGNVGVAAISTGALALDLALGIGGLPRGRVVEIYGPESSGKSTLAMHVVAEAQRNGGVCAYVDAEHAMDPVYAAAIGVNVDELYI